VGTLSAADLARFLQSTSVIAVLATLDIDGSPYQVPVWCDWDGSHLWIVSKPRAEYVQNLKRNPVAAVCVATQTLPYVRVLIQGTADLIDTDDEWLPMGYRMAERYLGKQEGDAYIEKTRHWKRIFIRITPTRVKSWDGGASGHTWGKAYIERTR
jgi:PPOX class probable F420-dependent enzyme